MKSERYMPRSAQALQPDLRGNETAFFFPYPVEHGRGKLAKGTPSETLGDLDRLLCFTQQLYAHALTLQEVIRSEGAATYQALRPQYDQLAAEQFQVLHHTFKPPSRLRKRMIIAGSPRSVRQKPVKANGASVKL